MTKQIALGEWRHRLESEIDDAVEAWHRGESDLPLWSFLGMSFQEYATWVTEGLPTQPTQEKKK